MKTWLNGFLQGCRYRETKRASNPVIPSEVEGSRGATKNLSMKHQNYFVYILTNDDRHTVLDIGITNDLERRVNEHSLGRGSEFAQQYNTHKLIYFETFSDPANAIEREKQLKNWSRSKKERLVACTNPEWRDLIDEMHTTRELGGSR